MNKLKEKYYIALGNLQNMAIDNTKGSKGVDICVLDINEYVAYLQSKIDKVNEYCEYNNECLYTFEPDYDYEENIIDNYVPSSFREDILEIIKEDK